MEKRRFGRTGLDVSVLTFGCGAVGGLMTRGEAADQDRAVAWARDNGINHFDTAPQYGNGASERALSLALKHAGKKNGDVVVATKWSPIFRKAKSIGSTIQERLSCLAPFAIELHQVHNPFGLSSVEAEMNDTRLQCQSVF